MPFDEGTPIIKKQGELPNDTTLIRVSLTVDPATGEERFDVQGAILPPEAEKAHVTAWGVSMAKALIKGMISVTKVMAENNVMCGHHDHILESICHSAMATYAEMGYPINDYPEDEDDDEEKTDEEGDDSGGKKHLH